MGRLYLVKRNEDVIDYLKKLAPPEKTSLRTAVFSGIGALSNIEFGYYNPISKGYSKLQINEQIELTSMIGNITLSKGQKKNKQTLIHCHATIAKKDGSVLGGHVFHAKANPFVELYIERGDSAQFKKFNKGLNLYELT